MPNPYTGETIDFPPGTPASAIAAYLSAIRQNQLIEAERGGTLGSIERLMGVLTGNPFVKGFTDEFFRERDLGYRGEQARDLFQFQEELKQRLQAEDEMRKIQQQEEELSRMSPALQAFLGAMGPQPGRPFQTMGAEPIQPSLEYPLPTREESLIETPGPTVQPTSLDALRGLAGRDPLFAARITGLLEKNTNLSRIITGQEELAREKAAAAIRAQEALTAARQFNVEAGRARLPGQLEGQEASTELKEAQVKRILEMLPPQVIEAITRANLTAGKSAEQDIKVGALKTLSVEDQIKALYPGLSKDILDKVTKTVAEELIPIQTLHPEWTLPQQLAAAKEAADKRISQRSGLTAFERERGQLAGQEGLKWPDVEQMKAYRLVERLSDRLGSIEELVPRVRLNQIMGGFRPWLNELERRWAINPESKIPEIANFIPGGRVNLTAEEFQFLARLENFADTWIRSRTGAQASFPELRSVRSFMPVAEASPQAFLGVLKSTREDILADFNLAHESFGKWGYRSPVGGVEDNDIRQFLFKMGMPATQENIKKIRSSPDWKKRIYGQ